MKAYRARIFGFGIIPLDQQLLPFQSGKKRLEVVLSGGFPGHRYQRSGIVVTDGCHLLTTEHLSLTGQGKTDGRVVVAVETEIGRQNKIRLCKGGFIKHVYLVRSLEGVVNMKVGEVKGGLEQ